MYMFPYILTYILTYIHSYIHILTTLILHTYIPEYREGEVELYSISEVGQRQILQVEE